MSVRVKTTSKTTARKRGLTVSKAQKPAFSPSAHSPIDQILYLQMTIGNRAVRKLIESGMLQKKLCIGKSNNIYEQEADRLADQVMRPEGSALGVAMPNPGLQHQPEAEEEEAIQTKPLAEQITPLVQRQIEPEEEKEEELIQPKPIDEQIILFIQRQEEPEEEEEPIQTRGDSSITAVVTPTVKFGINSLRGGRQPLPKSVRNNFAPQIGIDFSKVRIHSGPRATDMAKSINAKALKKGKYITFGGGQYSPTTTTGKPLLNHELAHVVQQRLVGRVKLKRRPLLQTELLEKVLQRAPRKGSQLSKLPVRIVVDLSDQKARVYRGKKLIRTMRISSGKRGFRTPTGNFSIYQRDIKHRSTKYGRCTYKPKDFYIKGSNKKRCRFSFRRKYKYIYKIVSEETGYCPIGRVVKGRECRRNEVFKRRGKVNYCIRKTRVIKGGRKACRRLKGGIEKLYKIKNFERGVCKYKTRTWRVTKGKTACGAGKYKGDSMPFFQRFHKAIGFHKGNIPNYPASHGCVRLSNRDAKWLWKKAQIGTKVRVKS